MVVEEDVQALDVSVNNVLGVQILDGLTNLVPKIPDVFLTEVLSLSPLLFQHPIEITLLCVFHDDVNGIILDKRVVVPIKSLKEIFT